MYCHAHGNGGTNGKDHYFHLYTRAPTNYQQIDERFKRYEENMNLSMKSSLCNTIVYGASGTGKTFFFQFLEFVLKTTVNLTETITF